MARRQGLRMAKVRRRDRRALDYGMGTLWYGQRKILGPVPMSQIEAILRGEVGND